MIRSIPTRILGIWLCAAIFILGFTGCEDDDDGSGLMSISPASVSLDITTSTDASFTASDGAGDYLWSVSDDSLGSISSVDANAIYYADTVVGVNYITVIDSYGSAAVATVTQTEGTSTNGPSGDLTVIPETAVIPVVALMGFAASGGTSPYSWSVSDTNLGSIGSSGESVVYYSTTNAGVNTITLTDAASDSVTATVTQN